MTKAWILFVAKGNAGGNGCRGQGNTLARQGYPSTGSLKCSIGPDMVLDVMSTISSCIAKSAIHDNNILTI